MTATLPINATVTPADPLSDAELVDRFASVQDAEAITELVRRHSSVVLGVCQRVLRNADDIEDVFQATFLVLVRDASRIRRQPSIAHWLYGVAYRLALRVARQRQRRRETMLVDDVFQEQDTLDELASRHDQQLVDAELNALPVKYRLAIVLRYLAGKSPGEIAKEMDITLGTLDGLLKRGKDQLRMRLMQRGVSLGVAMAALQYSQQVAQATCTLPLIDSTVEVGLAWQGGTHITPDPFLDRILELSGKELASMTTVTKTGLVAGVAVSLLAMGFGASSLIGNPASGQAEADTVASIRSVFSTAAAVEAAAMVQNEEAVEVESDPDNDQGKPWDRKQQSANARRIQRALQEATEVAFTNVPFEEAFHYFEDLHKIGIVIDQPSLQAAGASIDTKVTFSMSGVSLRSALELILEPLDLDYVIKNEVMLITSRDKADQTREVRVYDITRLNGITAAELDEIIRSTVAPGTWSSKRPTALVSDSPLAPATERGAESSKKTYGEAGAVIKSPDTIPTAPKKSEEAADTAAKGPKADGGNIRHTADTLIIWQNQRVHREIVDLLNQLEQTKSEPKAK